MLIYLLTLPLANAESRIADLSKADYFFIAAFVLFTIFDFINLFTIFTHAIKNFVLGSFDINLVLFHYFLQNTNYIGITDAKTTIMSNQMTEFIIIYVKMMQQKGKSRRKTWEYELGEENIGASRMHQNEEEEIRLCQI